MRNHIRTRETHPRHLPAGASVTAWPPSAVGPLRLNSEAGGEGGRQGGQMAHNTLPLGNTKAPKPGAWTGGGGMGMGVS